MFWWTVWLAVFLAGAKIALVSPVFEMTLPEIRRWVSDVLIISAADLAYALGIGVGGQIILACVSFRPRLSKAIYLFLVTLCVASVLYAFVNIHVFGFLNSPLTFAWLYVAGDMGNMRSSIARFLTPWVVIQLAGAPLIYVLLAGFAARRSQRRPARRFAWSTGLAVLSVAAVIPWNLAARNEMEGAWGARHDDPLIAESPHWILLASCVEELLGGETVTFSLSFPPEDTLDFQPAALRPDSGAPTPGLKRGPSNVILVVMESVGTQHLSLYGGKYPTMPRLEKEAASALVFDHVYAHVTNTANSLVSLVLGVYPPGLSHKEPTVETPAMPGTTLAEVLKARGYRTAFISSGDNDYANQGAFLSNRGFDTLWDWRDSGQERLFSWGVDDGAMVDMIFRWLDQDRTKPFFIMCWTQSTHHPYEIPWEREKIDFFKGDIPHDDWDLGNFLNALDYTDEQLQRLFDGLRQRKVADDTLAVLTGDHGEAFGVPHKNYGHSYKLYEEDVNVPLVIWNPKLFQAPPRPGTIGGLIDLPPTILDLLGLRSPGTWQGRSLFSRAHPHRAYFYGPRKKFYTLGVREGRFKYIYNLTWGREELYDLPADPDERSSRHRTDPVRCARLRQRLAAWFSSQREPARTAAH